MSYRSNYAQWKGTGSGSSSYSPASSTSSLASSSSTTGSNSTKFSSSLNTTNYSKTSDSRIPSRETSFGSGTGTASTNTASGKLGRYSALSSKVDSLSSSANSTTSSYISTNLSSGTKTNLTSPTSTTAPKDVKTVKSPGFGLASVSSLSSKFSSDSSSASSFRSANSSSYLRSSGTSTSASENATLKTKNSASVSENPSSAKPQPNTTANNNNSINATTKSGGTTSPAPGTFSGSSSNSYRSYASRTGSDLTLGNSAVSSALRTTARFGLRSGTSHAHYNSLLPTSSTLKAAAALAEETKKELYNKAEKKVEENVGPVTWKTRGTYCTGNSNVDDNTDEAFSSDGISQEETPSFEPRVFSPRYEGVLKHKGIQTEEEPKPKILPSSIPRPTLSLNYYNSSYGSALGRYGAKSPIQPATTNDKAPVITLSSTLESKSSNSDLKLKPRVGSVKEKDGGAGNNSSNSKTSPSSGLNNKKDNATPGMMTSGGDQSSRSSQQTINNKTAVVAVESSGTGSNNEHETSPSIIATETTTNSANGSHNGSNVVSSSSSSAAGVIINVANKEFRKSVLNVGLSKESQENFVKKQDELRLQKSYSKPSLANNDDIVTNSSLSSKSALKRDLPRRPPTDPSKSTIVNQNQSQNQSIPRATDNASFVSDGTNNNDDLYKKSKDKGPQIKTGQGLMRMKSSKSINQLRKLSSSSSSASESESCSSLSASSAKSNKSDGNKKAKKASLNNHNLDNKGPCRRGSATSCSSTASSRSNSVERSIHYNSNCTNKGNNVAKTGSANNSTNLSSQSKPPSGASSSIKVDQTKDLLKCKSEKVSCKEDSKANIKQIQKKDSANEPVSQTSFLSRTTGIDNKAWLRKCESGELPWWMKSNQDVPGILGRNPSISSISKKSTVINNSIPVNKSDSSDDDDEESELNESVLGERTAPDGVEVPTEIKSPLSTLVNSKSGFMDDGHKSRKNSQTLISNVENIDDILGSVSPSLIAETPSPAPTNPEYIDALFQRKLSINGLSDDDDSSSSESEIDDELKTEFQKVKESDSDETSDDDSNASTGTSSSFEEADPSSLGLKLETNKPCGSKGAQEQLQMQRIKTLLISEDKQKQVRFRLFQLKIQNIL